MFLTCTLSLFLNLPPDRVAPDDHGDGLRAVVGALRVGLVAVAGLGVGAEGVKQVERAVTPAAHENVQSERFLVVEI